MKTITSDKMQFSPEQREELIRVLKARFEKNKYRHKGLEWVQNLTMPPGDFVAL